MFWGICSCLGGGGVSLGERTRGTRALQTPKSQSTLERNGPRIHGAKQETLVFKAKGQDEEVGLGGQGRTLR